MSTTICPSPLIQVGATARGKNTPAVICSIGVFRLPTDPLFYMSVTLDNIIVGSRYRITRASDGLELATGIASANPEVVAGVPAYSSGMLTNITVRNASGTPSYKIFDTSIYANPLGASAYILQQQDE